MNNVVRIGLRLLVVAVCAIVGAYLFGVYVGALYVDFRSGTPVDKTQVLIHLGLALLGGFLLSMAGVGVSRGYIIAAPPRYYSGPFWGLFSLLYFRQKVDKQPLVDEPPDYPQGMDTTIEND